MCEATGNEQTFFAVDRADLSNGAMAGAGQHLHEKAILHAGAGYCRVDMRIMRKQYPIVAKKPNAAVLAESNGRKVLLEVLHFHCAEHQSEKVAAWSRNLANEMNGPRPGGPIAHRLPHEGRQVRVRLERFIELSIRDIDIRQRPKA